MEEQRAEEIAAEIKKLRDDAGKAFREAVARENELLQEYEKLTDQPFDDEELPVYARRFDGTAR